LEDLLDIRPKVVNERGETIEKRHRMLIFEAKKRQAERYGKELPPDMPYEVYTSGHFELTPTHMSRGGRMLAKGLRPEPRITVTYPRSTIARGVNLPVIDTIIANVAMSPPALGALVAGNMTNEKLQRAITKQAMILGEQACTRHLRPREEEQGAVAVPARRAIVLHNLPKPPEGEPFDRLFVDAFLRGLRTRARRVTVAYVEDPGDVAEVFRAFYEDRKLPRPVVKRQNVRLQRALVRLGELRVDGMPWVQARRMANLDRALDGDRDAMNKLKYAYRNQEVFDFTNIL
jgi:hypothetical protein